ncbi:hypothetical protein [Heyndrickxia vini]|uniref:DUF8042 domain-containing protein n=1 Tax=Heyndrickxia vini TaxID=1476025 RepID=A0ABX7E657_9BACI|nr:hypothetical protein [Heyndrickxia vini]QQZ10272.1 hypothetical protein I5776_04755 [Heyndrickxia vini]
MQVNILGDTFFYKNPEELNDILNKINQLTKRKKLIVSHYIIDGTEIFKPLEEFFLEEGFEKTKDVTVVAYTEREYIIHIMKEASDYLDRAIPALSSLNTSLFHNEGNNKWIHFQEFIEGMQWLVSVIHLYKKSDLWDDNCNEYLLILNNLQDQLKSLLISLEKQDITLLTDIIDYEIIPVLHSLKKQLQITLINSKYIEQ